MTHSRQKLAAPDLAGDPAGFGLIDALFLSLSVQDLPIPVNTQLNWRQTHCPKEGVHEIDCPIFGDSMNRLSNVQGIPPGKPSQPPLSEFRGSLKTRCPRTGDS